MKIATYEKYGGPEVLTIVEKEIPQPKPSQILIKVYAISLNPAEWHYLHATLFMLRFVKGLFKPKNRYLGADISGRVIQIGSEVTQFKIGDQVCGRNLVGGYAEYACIDESTVYFKPLNIDYKEAAAIPLASLTAIQGLQKGKLKSGQKVLINGASGGIGTFAVQIAKTYNVAITGICSTKNKPLVASLGADFVFDYTKKSISSHSEKYDLILDIVGNLSPKETKQLLKKGGICVVIGFESVKKMIHSLIYHSKHIRTNRKNIIMFTTVIKQDDLSYVKELIESKKIKPIIDQEFAFEDLRNAFDYLGTKRANGKIIISLDKVLQ